MNPVGVTKISIPDIWDADFLLQRFPQVPDYHQDKGFPVVCWRFVFDYSGKEICKHIQEETLSQKDEDYERYKIDASDYEGCSAHASDRFPKQDYEGKGKNTEHNQQKQGDDQHCEYSAEAH